MKAFIILILSLSVFANAALANVPLHTWTKEVFDFANSNAINTEQIFTNGEQQFIGNISIGTPPQNLIALFNISSTSLMVSIEYYNASASSTFTTTTGSLANETVRIAGLNITQQPFIITTGPISSLDANIGAVFGLGYAANDVTNSPSPTYNINAQQLTSLNSFSLRLVLPNATSSTASSTVGSELIFGAIDPNLTFGPMTIVSTYSNANWEFTMNATYINGMSASSNSLAILDSNSNATAVPASVYSSLQNYLQQPANADGSYNISCDAETPIFIFTMDTENLTLTAQDFMMQNANNETVCVFNVQNAGSGPWSLGTHFLAKYYTLFDQVDSLIAFVPYANTAESTTMGAITTTEPQPQTYPTSTQDPGNNGSLFYCSSYQKILIFFVMLLTLCGKCL